MAKGTQSKTVIFEALRKTFPDAFWEEDGKILRIPLDENGDIVEIKVTLTAAKVAIFKALNKTSAFSNEEPAEVPVETPTHASIEPTEEEKQNVEKLLRSLNF